MLPRHEEIGLSRRIVEACCIAIAASAWVAHATRFVFQSPVFSWWSLALAAAGMAAADLASGVVHWAADTWGRESMPILGRRLLHPFRVHHVNPDDLLNRRFLDANGDVAMIALPFLLAMFWIPLDETAGRGAVAFLLGLWGVGLWTNQVHQWAHMPRPPLPVRLLQDGGIILSRGAHQRHHWAPHTTDYCIATGWCNGLLNRAGFFARLEKAITRATGWKPREDEARFIVAVSGTPQTPEIGKPPP